jgi:TatD DNase family protein
MEENGLQIEAQLIDIGANLTNKRFAQDLNEVLDRAKVAGVQHIILTGTSGLSSEQALSLAETNRPLLSCTAGVHPHDAKNWNESSRNHIRKLAEHSAVVAIGECGLDFNRDFSPRPLQEMCFESQLELAVELGKPVFLHERDAHDRFFDILKAYRDDLKGAVVHCFTGNKKELFNYLNLDCHIGITGWVCDERRGIELRELVKNIPASRLMIETDSPYLAPRDLRPKPKGGRNEPYCLNHIADVIAKLRGVTLNQFAEDTFATTSEFFSLHT